MTMKNLNHEESDEIFILQTKAEGGDKIMNQSCQGWYSGGRQIPGQVLHRPESSIQRSGIHADPGFSTTDQDFRT